MLGLALACAIALPGCRKPSITGRRPDIIFGDRGLGPGQFVYPRAIALAPDGCVFVVDKTARIQRFGLDGEFETCWQMPEWQAGKPVGLTVDDRGRLFVADTHYHRVMIFDRDGHELGRFGEKGTGDEQFDLPTSVALGHDGQIYVGEYGINDRISRFTPDFKFIGAFGREDMPGEGLLRPESVVVDGDGTLWVADACRHRICHFDPDGRLLSTFGTPGREPGQLQYPYDLAFCPDGTILVCEFGNNRLQRFDREGHSLETWGDTGREPGQLLAPWGVVVNRDGRVYVVDSGNNRVQVFRM